MAARPAEDDRGMSELDVSDLLTVAQAIAIIDAAECLWAAQGIEGASLRQIGAAASCGNASARDRTFS